MQRSRSDTPALRRALVYGFLVVLGFSSGLRAQDAAQVRRTSVGFNTLKNSATTLTVELWPWAAARRAAATRSAPT